MIRRQVAAALAAGAVLVTGCSAPSDDDGESGLAGRLAPAPTPSPSASAVVVDTDLGGDDLVALSFLLRHPDVRVVAVTIAGTGLVGCDPGVDVLADLLTALGEPDLPVACGREEAGEGGRALPAAWRELAASGTGIPRDVFTLQPTVETAPELIGRVVARGEPLTVVALGPLTNLADLAAELPDALADLAGVHAMGGSVDGPLVDGVAEWNAAADPAALTEMLASGVPLTLVPEDAVPTGTPGALDAPVVGEVAAAVDYPAWWDLAAAAALVVPDAARVETATVTLDDTEPGRLRLDGDGPVRVVRALDSTLLDPEYARAFTAP